MKRIASCLALLCISACHEPFSNEDILFLKSLPRDVQFDVPADSTMSSLIAEDAPRFYRDMVATSTNVNSDIFDVLKKIASITSSAAVVRDNARRAWGPVRQDPMDEVERFLVVDRVETATVVTYTKQSEPLETDVVYRYAFTARRQARDPWLQILFGESVVLDANEDEATGYFCIDLGAIASLGGEPNTGTYCASYDFRGDDETVELAVRIAGDIFVLPFAAFSLHRNADGSGRFFFSQQTNVFGTELLEIASATVRWDATLAARADASICGGDATFELWWTECWNEAFKQTFSLANIPDAVRSGSLELCPAEFRETDALAQPCSDP
jgi:hypothetical protein